MTALKSAIEMIEAAQSDLNAIGGMVNDTATFSDAVFGFHSQQATEKALKSWIACLGHDFPFTHDIGKLLEILSDLNQQTDEFTVLMEYDPYAVGLRYAKPDIHEDPLDRELAIARTSRLVQHVRQLINSFE